MNWDQILELYNNENVEIGNHSHSHEYLVEENAEVIKSDIIKSMKIFEERLGSNSEFFSYPFGEFSLEFKKIIKDLGFKYAFGQHSGVIDETKDLWELPRFPINEKYGELKRFKSIINYMPLEFKTLIPEEKMINQNNNPPKLSIEFFEKQKNIDKITCYSNDGGNWKKSNLKIEQNTLIINFDEKFLPRRGRINCSLNDNGKWRWFGTQFTVKN